MKSHPMAWRVRLRGVIVLGITIALSAGALVATAFPAAAENFKKDSGNVVAVGTGRALADISALRRAMRSVRPDGTVQLVGTFNLNGCVACVLIQDGITVEGANAEGRPAKATLMGGAFPFVIAVRDKRVGSGSGNLTLQRLHFTGQTMNAVYFFKTVAETKFLDNTITNVSAVTVGTRGVRSPLVAAQFWPNGAVPESEEILKKFPALGRLISRFRGEFNLQGNITFSRNIIDLQTPAAPFGLENTIAMFGDNFANITIDHNYLASYGETIELEYGRNPEGVRTIEHNTVIMIAVGNIESELFGVGNPAAISLEASQARVVNIIDNDVITSGAENGTGIGGGTANEATVWQVIGNRIQTAGQIPFPGGFHGLDPFFTGSSMINTLYKDNTISGFAKYGFWFDTDNEFDPISHGNTLGPNNFRDFTPTSGTTVFLGPKTYNNTVKGPLNGAVTDLGTNNVITSP